jgi:signal transduction histidine kinase
MNRALKNTIQLGLIQAALFALSVVSYRLTAATHSLLLYIPLVMGIVFVHWFGWRVLPGLFINGITTLLIWGVTDLTPRLWIVSTHEAVVALSSRLLFCKLFPVPQGTQPLGNTHNFLRFVLLAVLIPITINSLYVYHYSFVDGNIDKTALYWLSDFITVLPLSIALLYFIQYQTDTHKFRLGAVPFSRRLWFELALVSLLFVVLSLLFPFDRYWFIYGIGATLFALRWGFAAAVLLNTVIFVLIYLLPLFEFASPLLLSAGSTQFISVHIGMSTMMFVSVLVGRVVSDLHETEKNLVAEKQRVETVNRELQLANEELDRFAYSVSHDLSAPLKSIKGLVAISRLQQHEMPFYLEKIDQSANRLEEFINEVLDYSRTQRRELVREDVCVKSLLSEITSRFEFLDNYAKIQFSQNIQTPRVRTDRLLLKVALGNLMANAIKYQKTYKDHTPRVTFSCTEKNGEIIFEVEDNGEGIRTEHQKKVFDMFYRGSATGSGSGLGLYIARAAVKKLGGTIAFKSEWGAGSVFRISLPKGLNCDFCD